MIPSYIYLLTMKVFNFSLINVLQVFSFHHDSRRNRVEKEILNREGIFRNLTSYGMRHMLKNDKLMVPHLENMTREINLLKTNIVLFYFLFLLTNQRCYFTEFFFLELQNLDNKVYNTYPMKIS